MAKGTIEEMRRLAKKKGGECLSKVYIGSLAKLEWQCEKGHVWEAIPSNIKTGHWCPQCFGHPKGTIERMNQLAKPHGGRCLSEAYIDSQTKLEWQCKNGHRFTARPNSVQQGNWCPRCARNAKGDIGRLQAHAESKGGKCLSREYFNCYTKMKWQCKKGHMWQTTAREITRGSWCPVCASHKRTIEEMQELAKARGGECLSTRYISSKAHLEWQCKEGHRWRAPPNSILRGMWCGACYVKSIKGTIEGMRSLAESRGGRCLSDTYVNRHTKLEWQCKEGHIWRADPHSVKRGSWCARCFYEGRSRK